MSVFGGPDAPSMRLESAEEDWWIWAGAVVGCRRLEGRAAFKALRGWEFGVW